MAAEEEDWERFFCESEKPANYEESQCQIREFCNFHKVALNKVVLVTSGGTTVPFERNVVRLSLIHI